MARQTPDARNQASQQRLNDRKHGIRSNLAAREKRLGREIVDDLSNLLPPQPPPTLRREESRGGIPAARGYAESNYQPGAGQGGAGIASPLTEGAVAPEAGQGEDPARPKFDREFYDETLFYSNNYLIAAEMKPLKRIRMRDANGSEATLHFAAPVRWEG